MKKTIFGFLVMVVIIAGLTGCGASSVEQSKPNAIIEKIEKGDVFLKRVNETDFSKTAVKIELFVGDTLKTSENAEALIRYKTGAVTRVLPNSEFSLKELKFAEKEMETVYAKLIKGIAYFYVPKGSGEAKKFEVETERAIASIKGTSFKMSDNGQISILSVASGVVNLFSKVDNKNIEVREFQEAQVDTKGLVKFEGGADEIKGEPFLRKFNFLDDTHFSDLTLQDVSSNVIKGSR